MKKTACLALLMAAALALGGCAVSAEPAPAPAPEGATARAQVDWPKERLETDENGVPVLDVYVVADEQVERVDVETYVEGVLAGEMKNDWPLEALKAQAILARTFVLKFLADKQSKYEGADISTDIEEAQAYDASAVNDRIRQAVSETEGLVLSAGGELPYAWFHAHSGGLTALAREGLGWDKDEPPYTQIVPGNEPESATGEKDAQMLREAQHWQASFPYEEVEAACETLGVDVTLEDGAKLTIEERGDSGRAVSLGLNGQTVDASDLRIALGSTKMRSTLITSLRAQEGKLVMAGTGYGHGVGMSQWGAYGMAQAGSTAEEIVTYYFKDVSIEKLWGAGGAGGTLGGGGALGRRRWLGAAPQYLCRSTTPQALRAAKGRKKRGSFHPHRFPHPPPPLVSLPSQISAFCALPRTALVFAHAFRSLCAARNSPPG